MSFYQRRNGIYSSVSNTKNCPRLNPIPYAFNESICRVIVIHLNEKQLFIDYVADALIIPCLLVAVWVSSESVIHFQ